MIHEHIQVGFFMALVGTKEKNVETACMKWYLYQLFQLLFATELV